MSLLNREIDREYIHRARKLAQTVLYKNLCIYKDFRASKLLKNTVNMSIKEFNKHQEISYYLFKASSLEIENLNLLLSKNNQIKGSKSCVLTYREFRVNKITYKLGILIVPKHDRTVYYLFTFRVNSLKKLLKLDKQAMKKLSNKAEFLKSVGFEDKQALRVAFLTEKERNELKTLNNPYLFNKGQYGKLDTVGSPTEEELELLGELRSREEIEAEQYYKYCSCGGTE